MAVIYTRRDVPVADTTAERQRVPGEVSETFVDRVRTASALDAVAQPLDEAVKRWIPSRSSLEKVLGRTTIDHPLHPILTCLPIGSFTSAAVLDLFGGRRSRRAAGTLLAVGFVASVPTAAADLTDWSDASRAADKRVGLVQAAANAAGLGFYALSLFARGRGRKLKGTALGLIGLGGMTMGSYLGDHLAFRRGVGTNESVRRSPEDVATVRRKVLERPHGVVDTT